MTSELGALGVFVRLGAAIVLGGCIGLERELRGKEAGLKTNTLVALASALFTVVTLELSMAVTADDVVVADPIRTVEAVTAGVAFIAAGAILSRGKDVRGLTTGASMWLAGAVGLSCGAGFYAIAAMATGMGLAVLIGLRLVERRIERKRD